MSRRRRLNLFDKIILVIIGAAVLFALVMGIVGAIRNSIQASEDAAYHAVMAPALDGVEASQVTGDKAVAYMIDDKDKTKGTYSQRIIPEELRTDDPEEVRFIVTCEEGSSVIGTYTSGGRGYRRWCKVEIKDLKTGQIIDSNTFHGSEPPQTVKGSGDHYGSSPSESKITEWVMTVLGAKGETNETVTQSAQTESTPETQATQEPTEKADKEQVQVLSEAALERAEELLAMDIGFSPRGLETYLKGEGFSSEEAKNAVENCDADWFEQAVKAGGSAIETYDHIVNREELLWFLEQCGFTSEQGEYAADVLGF